jgi:hypothetical protein
MLRLLFEFILRGPCYRKSGRKLGGCPIPTSESGLSEQEVWLIRFE